MESTYVIATAPKRLKVMGITYVDSVVRVDFLL